MVLTARRVKFGGAKLLHRCSNHLTLKAFCASPRKATAVEAATQEMLKVWNIEHLWFSELRNYINLSLILNLLEFYIMLHNIYMFHRIFLF